MRSSIGILLLIAAAGPVAVRAANPPVTIYVDAVQNRHVIDARVYGVAFADAATLADLGITLNRWGGNAMSRYNWAFSTANHCKDYYFENVPDGVAGDGSNGESADDFIGPTLAAGAQPIMTIPMMGLLPKDRSYRCGFSIALYGAQSDADFKNRPDCGNGRYAGVDPSTNASRMLHVNDPADTSAVYTSAHQFNWVQHIVSKWGSAKNGGVRYYGYDNEPVLWSFDHWDAHPDGSTFDEIRDKWFDYGPGIKAKDPDALLLGPEEWGWSGYFISGLDSENGNTNDQTAHGGTPLSVWLLQQAKSYEMAHGQRILDVFTLHFYPQGGEFSDDISTATQLLRNRSTRSLWDPAYVNESWIGGTGIDGGVVKLIPRMKQWVAANYPGTAVGLTEYNWGADSHINGGTAQADVLGILGREGADLAVRWTSPAAGSYTYNAFKMYRNHDGRHSSFGDFSVSSTGTNPDEVASFASVRSADNALVMMIVTKRLSGGDTPATINLAHFPVGAGAVQRWQLDSANVITRLPDLAVAANSLSLSLPQQSITLLAIPGVGAFFGVGRGDFNADFDADILLRDANGNIGMWLMNAAGIRSGAFVGSPGGSYTIAGIADFNGDGKADILLRDSLGSLGMWLMNGAAIASGAFVGSPGGSYTVAGVGDFNGDGKADILLRDSLGNLGMWLMNGPVITSGAFVGSPGNYTVAGIGDFDGDGKSDILLRDSNGAFGMWLMNGPVIRSGAFVGAPGGSYNVAGIGDFNGDGRADVLLRDNGGSLGMWMMNGPSIASGAFVGSPGSYTVAAVRDYDGDGKADILLRDSLGSLGMWLMDGPVIKSGAFVGAPGSGYTAY